MSIILQNISFQHPDGDILFTDLSFSIEEGDKVALIGDNGTGKSTLLKLISGEIPIQSGSVYREVDAYVVPQNIDEFSSLTVAEALKVDAKIIALHQILAGNVEPAYMELLGDDWDIEERVIKALHQWGLDSIRLEQTLSTLSGGERVKVFLSGLTLHQPQLVLMDEPTNHLDYVSKDLLYSWIEKTSAIVLIVSHDRELLDLLSGIYELSSLGIKYYSGNYTEYKEQKEIELNAIENALKGKEVERKVALKKQQKVAERRQKLDNRGKDLSIKKGIGKMGLDTRQDRAEKTSARYKSTQGDRVNALSGDIQSIKDKIAQHSVLKLHIESSDLHDNKILVEAKGLNFEYVKEKPLWKETLNFLIRSGERVLLRGINGSGKTTLLNLITGSVKPTIGKLDVAPLNWMYLDQDYLLLNPSWTVYEQAQNFNSKMPEHEVKCMLHRSQLSESFWDKPCSSLSGGEKMKLSLCSLLISSVAPDLLILDEPTNNIDIHSIEILTETVRNYAGSILLVSHDDVFIQEVGIDYELELK
ncbi:MULTISPECIES: ABC-F family ATP-binding cassette domain-containing protein [Bacteroides]|uniref:ABC-F family ATP-binding cassette domain-containing protein n=1 Tax=Bacteroides TaxID=816 RepID=UPI001DCB5E6D|nr:MULTISPECIES: ATP-binding cassette domain-containing protein [Bacteroides]HJD93076.1 ATP-binding cassette domain-containing protein [Bacteroides coprosuis]